MSCLSFLAGLVRLTDPLSLHPLTSLTQRNNRNVHLRHPNPRSVAVRWVRIKRLSRIWALAGFSQDRNRSISPDLPEIKVSE